MFIDNVFDNQRMNACLLTEQPFYLEHLGFGHLPSLSEIGCDSLWVHEYVITCLLENAVSWKINDGGRQSEAYPLPTLIHGHAPCLSGKRHSRAPFRCFDTNHTAGDFIDYHPQQK